MESLLGRISRNISGLTGLFFGIAKRVDYETLSRCILDINRMRDLDSILKQASDCLNDILNYRFFAFALQHRNDLDLWVDPENYEKALRCIIVNDFNLSGEAKVHYINEGKSKVDDTISFHANRLQSCVLMDDNYFAKLYIVPQRRILDYHSDILNIIARTMEISISNIVNIEKLKSEAAFDQLTDCYNRREFDRLIEQSIANAHRYNRGLSMIMSDIDHFKVVNDTHGHLAGDKVLKEVSKTLRTAIRKGDYVARYGGEEFIIVLPDTKLNNTLELAERLRKVIENHAVEISEGKILKVTASFGVSTLKKSSNKESMIKEADEMLYRAKINGRNMVMPGVKLRLLDGIKVARQHTGNDDIAG